MERPLISIVIPVKNGEATLWKCLNGIFSQGMADKIEVILIDSGSKDDSIRIAKEFPVRFYAIAPESFNHGETRNMGVSLALGEFIVMTVQDAIPADENWLLKLWMPFKDEQVMAVSGRQIVPHQEKINPHQWYRPIGKPKTEKFSFKNPADFWALSETKRRWVCGIDDVTCMYRKKALTQLPFRSVAFAEDFIWASDAYQLGYTIAIAEEAMVYHYHYQTYSYAYKLSLTCAYFEWKYLKIEPFTNFRYGEILLIIYRNFRYKAHVKWIFHQVTMTLGINKAKSDFKRALLKSELEAEKLYSTKCREVPQGKLKP